MKKSKWIPLMMVLLLLHNTAWAGSSTFSISPYPQGGAENLTLYRSTTSLNKLQEAWVFPTSSTQFLIPNPVSDGFYFHHMTAHSSTDRSGPSEEVLMKFCGGVACQANFTAEAGIDSVYLDFETPYSVSGYQVKYSVNGGPTTVMDINGPSYIYNLEPGTYTFKLYPKDALGRLIINNPTNESLNLYPTIQATVALNEPPSAPAVRVESLGYGVSQRILMGIRLDDPSIVHFNVNGYSSSAARNAAMTSKAPGDVFANIQVPYGDAFCRSFTGEIIFLRITAVDCNGVESESTASYRLMGDIIGTEDDGTVSQNAVIDATDKATVYAMYKLYAITKYPLRAADFCTATNVYDLLPFTNAEISDVNGDRIVGTFDYKYILSILGRTGAGK